MTDDSKKVPEELTQVIRQDHFNDWGQQRQLLVLIRGDRLGTKIDLSHSGRISLTIGRGEEAEFTINDDAVSRVHCQLKKTDEGWLLIDLNSTNGTFLSMNRVITPYELNDGDCFKLGQTIFKFISTNEVEASYYEEIYQLAVCDGLTQVPNRRVFDEAIEKEFARAARHKRHLSLIMFDLDHFKEINDNFGHISGDMALQAIARVFYPRVRCEDTFARYAGDEFVWLLTETLCEDALRFAEWMVEVVSELPLFYGEEQIPLSISVGVAHFRLSMDQASDLIAAADEALYRAKRAGRGRASN